MVLLLAAAVTIAFEMPASGTLEDLAWSPPFTEPSDLAITVSTLGIVTHSSSVFDPLRVTEPGVQTAVNTMKRAGLPVLYLHDRYNIGNPAWMYLYDDWQPTAYVASDVGHIETNLAQVEHVVCMGGFFEQCENSTMRDVLRLWHRDGFCHDLRITQLTDAIFTVGQHVRSEDAYNDRVREFNRTQLQARHSKAAMSVQQVLARIETLDQTADFLQRHLPGAPADINVVMDVFGVIMPLQVTDEESPVLTLAYRQSDDFLDFSPPLIDWSKPTKRWKTWLDAPRISLPIQRHIITQEFIPSAGTVLSDGEVIFESQIPDEPLPSGMLFDNSYPILDFPTGNTIPSATPYFGPAVEVFP